MTFLVSECQCRLGTGQFRPFSGMAVVCDFAAHMHRDTNNMRGGITAILTLTKDAESNQETSDQQVHILPHYTEVSSSSPVGGLGLLLMHGSVLIEYAKAELHATSALRNPNKFDPSRIGIVLYQHKNLVFKDHGKDYVSARRNKLSKLKLM